MTEEEVVRVLEAMFHAQVDTKRADALSAAIRAVRDPHKDIRFLLKELKKDVRDVQSDVTRVKQVVEGLQERKR